MMTKVHRFSAFKIEQPNLKGYTQVVRAVDYDELLSTFSKSEEANAALLAERDLQTSMELLARDDMYRKIAALLAAQPASVEAVEWCDKIHLVRVIQDVVASARMSVTKHPDAEVARLIYAAITEHLPIYEDVYDQVSEMIEPHVKRPYRPDAPLPASVVDSVRFLLEIFAHPPRAPASRNH